jgi:Methyltransferase domain
MGVMGGKISQVFSRGVWRRLGLGLPTLFGMTARGFFIPYRYHGEILPARPAYGSVLGVFQQNEDLFVNLLSTIDAFAADLLRINGQPPPAPRWGQDWFPRLDAAAAYAVVRRAQPARIVEVGAGHSTRFLARAVADGKLATTITAIDPAPRARLDGLDVRLIKKTVERAGDEPFMDLKGGDILSIDSSHVLMPGTDVDVLLNRVLPKLPSGVLVHLHDIFLPDDYPEGWGWRGYNEQLAVAALLLGGHWQVLWSSRYARSHLGAAVSRSVVSRLPLPPGAFESSLWLEKRPSHRASGGVADASIHTDRRRPAGHPPES